MSHASIKNCGCNILYDTINGVPIKVEYCQEHLRMSKQLEDGNG